MFGSFTTGFARFAIHFTRAIFLLRSGIQRAFFLTGSFTNALSLTIKFTVGLTRAAIFTGCFTRRISILAFVFTKTLSFFTVGFARGSVLFIAFTRASYRFTMVFSTFVVIFAKALSLNTTLLTRTLFVLVIVFVTRPFFLITSFVSFTRTVVFSNGIFGSRFSTAFTFASPDSTATLAQAI